VTGFTLPVLRGAGCTMGPDGFAQQRLRVETLRAHVERVEPSEGALRVVFDDDVDPELVDEFLVAEGACCGFLALGWDRDERALTIGADDEAGYDVVGGFAAVFSGGGS
jgi:hypothetical protein